MPVFIVIAIVVWVCAMGAWLVASKYLKSSDEQRVKTRLMGDALPQKKEGAPASAALFQKNEQQKGQWAVKLLEKYDLADKTSAFLEQAGSKWTVSQFVHYSMISFIVAYVLGVLVLPDIFQMYVILVAAASATLPFVHVFRMRRARLRAFEEIFPDALEFVSRSMRAGHAFSVSLEMLHREFSEPLSGEFRRAFEEHNLGLPLDVALQGLSKRIPLLDVHFFVSAVLLQKRTGGNLAEILDKLAYVIRERFKLRGRIRAISAHGRMTGIALSCIPIAVAILMFFTNPDYVKFFFLDETGNIMLGAAVGLQLIGYLIMKKIVAIEV